MKNPIKTAFTQSLGLSYPLIAAPMFLVSNEDLVVAASEAGAIGCFPALNYRPIEKYEEALRTIRSRTKKPISVNVIVHQSNLRQQEDLRLALKYGVELFITSLGNPKEVIHQAHQIGAKVYCDVTNLVHAKKVQDLGADGVIAVGSGAGGHAGPISPLVLIPWLKSELSIPIIAAGGVANGATLAAVLALGASGASLGTRFIASQEAKVDEAYKSAILKSTPEDIILTRAISGTPASVINTDYVQRLGKDIPLALRLFKNSRWLRKVAGRYGKKAAMNRLLEDGPNKPSWKTVWSAGQTVGLIDDVQPTAKIIEQIVDEYHSVKAKMP